MTTPQYEPELWQELFWSRGDRFYACALRQNLFGEWVILQQWGGRQTGKGGRKETIVATPEDGHRLIQQIQKRRRYRGYFPV
jgi:hypothetical protein